MEIAAVDSQRIGNSLTQMECSKGLEHHDEAMCHNLRLREYGDGQVLPTVLDGELDFGCLESPKVPLVANSPAADMWLA